MIIAAMLLPLLENFFTIKFSPVLGEERHSPAGVCRQHNKFVLERFNLEKGETRGGGTAPPGP
ncbi:hypothetical protein QUW15_12535, partial [Desulfovibrio piger]|nr:hypothetical protein [Desulfovibrio piger]